MMNGESKEMAERYWVKEKQKKINDDGKKTKEGEE